MARIISPSRQWWIGIRNGLWRAFDSEKSFRSKNMDKTMASRIILPLLLLLLLTSCSADRSNATESILTSQEEKVRQDTAVIEVDIQPVGIDLFIDSMRAENYLLDTNRIKQTIWSSMADHPNAVDNGHPVIQFPFPVESFQEHFTHPRTYFFAHWNETEKTFKNGTDYLLMTWTIDSAGILNEKEIYASLHEYMGNFPCYIFRSNNTVYAMSHRLTTAATRTRELTERLRDYTDKNAILYRPFGGSEAK
ncbi:MAG: hypothetical protein IPN95_08885 [Bacteroidetes bacterium]|nr:hypothetical protein [Bacteroidota bacterium]MBL0018184.1 hypothetical protein [Bacteroidota bacterium]